MWNLVMNQDIYMKPEPSVKNAGSRITGFTGSLKAAQRWLVTVTRIVLITNDRPDRLK